MCLATATLSGWKLLMDVLFETKHLQILMFKNSFRSQQQLIILIKNDKSHVQNGGQRSTLEFFVNAKTTAEFFFKKVGDVQMS